MGGKQDLANLPQICFKLNIFIILIFHYEFMMSFTHRSVGSQLCISTDKFLYLSYFESNFLDSAQKESRFPTGRISLHCNGVDECGQIISPVLCLQWL